MNQEDKIKEEVLKELEKLNAFWSVKDIKRSDKFANHKGWVNKFALLTAIDLTIKKYKKLVAKKVDKRLRELKKEDKEFRSKHKRPWNEDPIIIFKMKEVEDLKKKLVNRK